MNITQYRAENQTEQENIPALKKGDSVNVVKVETRKSSKFGDMLVLHLANGDKRRTFSGALIKRFTKAGNAPADMLAEGQTVEGTIVEKTEVTVNGKTQRTRPFLDIE